MTQYNSNDKSGIFSPNPKPSYKKEGIFSYLFGSRKIAGVVMPVFLFFTLVGIVWYSYPKSGEEKIVPIIQADPTPYRQKPTDTGGIKFAHQNSEIFKPIEKEIDTVLVEKLISNDGNNQEKSDLKTKELKLNLNLQSKQTGKTVEAIIAKEETIPLSELKNRLKNPDILLKNSEKKQPAVLPILSKNIAKPKMKPKIINKNEAKTEIVKTIKPKQTTNINNNSIWTVQIGAFSNEKSAIQAWRQESRKYPNIMAGIPYLVKKAKKGNKIIYRLRVGSFKTRTTAVVFCEKLKSKGGSCIVAK